MPVVATQLFHEYTSTQRRGRMKIIDDFQQIKVETPPVCAENFSLISWNVAKFKPCTVLPRHSRKQRKQNDFNGCLFHLLSDTLYRFLRTQFGAVSALDLVLLPVVRCCAHSRVARTKDGLLDRVSIIIMKHFRFIVMSRFKTMLDQNNSNPGHVLVLDHWYEAPHAAPSTRVRALVGA